MAVHEIFVEMLAEDCYEGIWRLWRMPGHIRHLVYNYCEDDALMSETMHAVRVGLKEADFPVKSIDIWHDGQRIELSREQSNLVETYRGGHNAWYYHLYYGNHA
jgi:hypothetical protein